MGREEGEEEEKQTSSNTETEIGINFIHSINNIFGRANINN